MRPQGISAPDSEARGNVNPANRVAFADQLRGLAALLVVLSHLGGLFWLDQPAVAALTGLPPAFTELPPGTDFLRSMLNNPFQLGPAGVALFFLISGYVIPFSLRGRTWRSFLLARAVRLLPTYWAGFGFQVLVLLMVLQIVGGKFPRTITEVLVNALPGLHLIAWLPSLDGIVWTLDIEVLFYLSAALVAPMLLARSGWFLLVPGVAALVGGILTIFPSWTGGSHPMVVRALTGFALAAPMLVYMSVGSVLHLAEADARWRRTAFFVVPLLLAIFAALMQWWPHGSLGAQTPSYLLMAGIFTAAFLVRGRVPAWSWPTRLAAISYPLYVVHGLSGYAIMTMLMAAGWGPLPTFLAALVYAFTAATVLHRLVEEPTRRLSQRIGRAKANATVVTTARSRPSTKPFHPAA